MVEERKPDTIVVDDHKTVTIVVEGTPHEWPEEYITYAQVVTLEVPNYSQHPEITYAVRYKDGPATNPKVLSLPAAPSRLEKE